MLDEIKFEIKILLFAFEVSYHWHRCICFISRILIPHINTTLRDNGCCQYIVFAKNED